MANQAVFGIMKTASQTEQVLQALRSVGFGSGDVSLLFPDQKGQRDFVHEKHTKAPEGAVAGASAGGIAGGTIGLLLGVGALTLPGFGPLLAAGPLLATLSASAVGAAVGGVTGAIVGLGIPSFEATLYEGKLREGNTLISVHAESREDVERVKKVFSRLHVESVSTTTEAPVPPPASERGIGPIGPF